MTKETITNLQLEFKELEKYYKNIGFEHLSLHFHNAAVLAEEVERLYGIIDKLNAELQSKEEKVQTEEEKAAPALEG